ncbi:MAG: cation diffusion facilitator family transporter [Dehalococcoidia bacterium]|nr:cation diffusion facilitator family transporter [Dehalococcoidia bacterium]
MSGHFTSQKVLKTAALLLSITFLAELLGGIVFGSLSLISDSFHVISDLGSILIASFALSVAHKRHPTQQMAFGYHRLEVMSALFNGIVLSIISAVIFLEAWDRFQNPGEVETEGALVIAVVGLVVNLIVIRFFHHAPDRHHDVNIRSAYLHIMGDILASVSVVVGIMAIKLFDMPVIDPVVAAFVALLLLIGASRVLYSSAEILLHKSPQDIDRVRQRVLEIDGVKDFLDVRLWQVCSHLTVGTAHVVVSVDSLEATDPIKQNIRSIIQEEFDVRDITLECETEKGSEEHSHQFEHHH